MANLLMFKHAITVGCFSWRSQWADTDPRHQCWVGSPAPAAAQRDATGPCTSTASSPRSSFLTSHSCTASSPRIPFFASPRRCRTSFMRSLVSVRRAPPGRVSPDQFQPMPMPIRSQISIAACKLRCEWLDDPIITSLALLLQRGTKT